MDIYDELGVRKVINGCATVTIKGGSIMPPEVLDAMHAAAQHFVDIDELQEKAGRKIAELTHNEAAYVSCGAAAGMVLSTAACITGLDPEKRARLPFSDGLKNEIIMHKCGRTGYDFAIRQAGGRVVEIGTEAGAVAGDLEAGINEHTAAIFVIYRNLFMDQQVPIEEQCEIANRHGVPLIVDAAAQIPPVENLWRFTQMGAALAIFSGGKGLCGPQSSGLIVGRKNLIEACAFNACPRGFIGRPMKVGKEEIVGLLAAVRRYVGLDHTRLLQGYEDRVAWMISEFTGLRCVTARRSFPSEAGQPHPRAEIIFDEGTLGFTRDEIQRRLYAGDPAVFLASSDRCGILINPQTLRPEEDKIVIERIKQVLTA